MKPTTLIATAAATLVMSAAFSAPASSCGWKKYGYGAAAADAGEVRGYRAVKHYRHHRLYRPARLYRPVRYYRPHRLHRPVNLYRPVHKHWGHGCPRC